MYVTLEPCTHQGRTGPCTPEIVTAGVTRVISACEDPNPLVAGSGHAALRAAGIECEVGVGAEQARDLNRGFWRRMTEKRPWVCVKQAMSLDGGTALQDGQSQWVTGDQARADVQLWRAQSCAILSTAATVIRDSARLNVRLEAAELGIEKVRQPRRIIMDRRGESTKDLTLWSVEAPCTVFTVAEHAQRLREELPEIAEVEVLETEERGMNLQEMLHALAQKEINMVFVEAGAKFVGALLRQDLVDELIVYIAPRLLGEGAAPLATLPPRSDLPDNLDWTLQEARSFGADVRLRYYRDF